MRTTDIRRAKPRVQCEEGFTNAANGELPQVKKICNGDGINNEED